MATMWWIFHAMSPNRLDTQRVPIEMSLDMEGRTGNGKVGEAFDLAAEPIRNPVTGDPHRVRIDLPNGFEYRIAEIASGKANVRGRSISIRSTIPTRSWPSFISPAGEFWKRPDARVRKPFGKCASA